MSKSIADLLAEPEVRPSTTFKVTVGRGRQYVAETQQLTEEHDALSDERAAVLAQVANVPRAMGAPAAPPRVAEIDERLTEVRARLKELLALIADYEGEVTVTATRTDGEWAQWRVAHPARTEDQPGHREDLAITSGWCDSDALINDLATYVTAWEGEPLGEGQFDALGVMRPDKKQLARLVISLYETGDGLGELLRGLSAHLMSVTDSTSPAASGSPRSDSSAGSQSSGTDTSTTTTPAA